MDKIQKNIEKADFKRNISSYESEIDAIWAPCRAAIYSYLKCASEPILFRHYKHMHLDADDGIAYPRYSHDYCKLYVFISGKLSLIIDDKIYTPTCGSILTVGRGESHQSIFYGQAEVNYYEIDFPPTFFDAVSEDSPFYSMFFGERRGTGCSIAPSHSAVAKMFGIFEKIERDIEEGERYSDFLIYSRLVQLAAVICDSLSSSAERGSEQKIPATLKAALDYILANCITVSDTREIADYCHISVSYLCRMFKAYLGMTPVEYINSHKLARARYLLKNGMNVTEACFASGFNSYNYFIHVFKKNVGQTPGEYKSSEI